MFEKLKQRFLGAGALTPQPEKRAGAAAPDRASKHSGPVRLMAMASLVSLFVFVPLVLTQSIIFLSPELGAGVLALLAALIMFAIPFHDRETNTKIFFYLLITYIAANVLWPEYIAIDLPGLPYLTPSRVLLTVLIFSWVLITATSRQVYQRLIDRLWGLKLITIPIFLIIVLKAISMMLTKYPFLANIGFADQIITWYLPFLIAITLFNSHENIARGMKVFVLAASVIAVAVVWESITKVNPYSAYLGQLVTVDQRWLEEVFTPQYRDQMKYRAMGPFIVHLSMAEFMTIASPFALYWFGIAKRGWTKAYLVLALLLFGYCVYSADSRTSMLTAGIVVGAHLFIKSVITVSRRPNSPARPAILLAMLAGLAAAPVAGIVALNAMNWQNAFGAEGSRTIQFQLAGPRIAESPIIGHGPGNGTAAYVLNYKPNGRDLSIDNYYMTTILETGIPGFILFLFIPATLLMISYARAFQRRGDADMYLAFALFGTTFALIRTTLSQNENMNLFYIFLGAFMVLYSLPKPAEQQNEDTKRKRRRGMPGSFRRIGRHSSAYGAQKGLIG